MIYTSSTTLQTVSRIMTLQYASRQLLFASSSVSIYTNICSLCLKAGATGESVSNREGVFISRVLERGFSEENLECENWIYKHSYRMASYWAVRIS